MYECGIANALQVLGLEFYTCGQVLAILSR
jgi:hypothetical protein